MIVNLNASVGGTTQALIFARDNFEFDDTIFGMDSKELLIDCMKAEFLLSKIKEYGFTEYEGASRVYEFIMFLKSDCGLDLEWQTSLEIEEC